MSGHQQQQTRIYAKSANGKEDKEPLAEHTINDIKAGRRLIENLPFISEEKERIGKDLDLIIACHDIGKAATGFQASLEKDAAYWGYRHEIVSAAFATALGLPDSIVFSIITHHKAILSNGQEENARHRCLPEEQLPGFGKDWDIMSSEWNANLPLLTKEWSMICEYLGRPDLTKSLALAPSLSQSLRQWLRRGLQIDFPYQESHKNN